MKELRQIGSDPLDELPRPALLGTAHLLIIGIDAYAACPPLQNAVRDAQAMADVLTQHYQFEAAQVTKLLDRNATRSNIHAALRRYAQTLGETDSLLIYYAGHGSYDKVFDRGYWVPVEGRSDDPSSFFSSDDIVTALRSIKTLHTLVISDSCFSGSLFVRDVSPSIEQRLESIPSRWMMTSGRNEVVPDDGPFAKTMIKYLKNNALPELRFTQVFKNIETAIIRNSWQLPRFQPLFGVGDEGGEFVLRLKTKRDDDTSKKQETAPNSQQETSTGVRDSFTSMHAKGLQDLIRQLGGPVVAGLLLLAALLVIGTSIWSLTSSPGTEPSPSQVPSAIQPDTPTVQPPIAQVLPQKDKPLPTTPNNTPNERPTQPSTAAKQPTTGKTATSTDGATKPVAEPQPKDPEPEPSARMCTVRCNTFGIAGIGASFIHAGQPYTFKVENENTLSASVPCSLTRGGSVQVTFTRNGKAPEIRNISLSDSRAFEVPAALRED